MSQEREGLFYTNPETNVSNKGCFVFGITWKLDVYTASIIAKKLGGLTKQRAKKAKIIFLKVLASVHLPVFF